VEAIAPADPRRGRALFVRVRRAATSRHPIAAWQRDLGL